MYRGDERNESEIDECRAKKSEKQVKLVKRYKEARIKEMKREGKKVK